MLRLAAAGDAGLSVDDCELRRGGLSYTIDTLAEIGARYAIEGKPGLVVGDDLIPGFGTWHRPSDIAGAADLVCAHRGSVQELPLAYPHRYAHNILVQISSSMVRERIFEGRPFRHLLDLSVYDYIREHGLYGLQ
jgi:nicotinate-nucleotide adenylyltransferase